MNELPSTKFRKTYGKLTESTAVTVNGHVIGLWTPVAAVDADFVADRAEPLSPPAKGKPVSPQAARDDLLNRINRKK